VNARAAGISALSRFNFPLARSKVIEQDQINSGSN
jgi:hypothetical protein